MYLKSWSLQMHRREENFLYLGGVRGPVKGSRPLLVIKKDHVTDDLRPNSSTRFIYKKVNHASSTRLF